MLTLADLLEALTGIHMDTPYIIPEAMVDSRLVIPGALFVAIPGEHVDGHDYIKDAFSRGAAVALIEKEIHGDWNTLDVRGPVSNISIESIHPPFCILVKSSLVSLQQIARFWRSKLDIKVVGITGSVGKSTTKEIVADVLSTRFYTLKNIGNLNNEIGLPLSILRLGPGHERAVLEMGFYVPGEIALLCEISAPNVGVVTNIGTVHASRAGSQDAIFLGKSELIKALPEDGTAILNIDDPLVRKMAGLTKAHVMFYGLDPTADLWADEIQGLGLDGIRFTLHHQAEVMHLHLPMIGQHSVHTALRAAAVGLVEGLGWNEILQGLHMGQTQLRLNTVQSTSGALILDDTYNASPESTLAALNLLDELVGRRIAVLGDMLELGQYEQAGHEMVGVRAAQVADSLVTVGQRGHLIAEAALRAGLKTNQVSEFKSAVEAIRHLQQFLTDQDVVLVKGSHNVRMDRIVSALEQKQ